MVEGIAHLRLVPHINWNAMYAGQQISEYNPQTRSEFVIALRANESPVNLFKIDFEKFPKVEFVERRYSEVLAAGDCIYIPAFYWYQIVAEADV